MAGGEGSGEGRVQWLRSQGFRLLWEGEDIGFAGTIVRVLGVSLWKFRQDRGFLRASALTYTSLLSLVPLLALMFAVLKGLGVQQRLEPILLQHLAVGNGEVVAQIIQYVDRTKVGALGAVGLITLLFTAVSVLGNVELSFNDIWQIRQGRNLLRKTADYIALLVVGPVLLLASISLTTTLQSATVLQRLSLVGPAVPYVLKALPLIAIWLAFTAMYMIMPNRRVPLISALIGGVTAGILWSLAEGAYIRFQFGMTKYNAIYGAMAQLPVLLVWIYLSWCIVLFGAELSFVHHLPERGRFLRRRHTLWVPRLDAALAILCAVARRFEQGQAAPTETELVLGLGLHPAEAGRVVSRLVKEGLLSLTQDEPAGVIPSLSPDRMSAADLIRRITQIKKLEDAAPEALSRGLRSLLDQDLTGVTWADLALEPGGLLDAEPDETSGD